MELPRFQPPLPRDLWTKDKVAQVARVTVFIVLSALGAMVKIGSPFGLIILANAPAFFAALCWGWVEGAAVGGLGTVLAGLLAGMPLGLPVLAYSAVQTALWSAGVRLAYDRGGIQLATIGAVLLAGAAQALLTWPLGGAVLVMASLPRLIISAAVNILLALSVFWLMNRSEVVYVRRRHY